MRIEDMNEQELVNFAMGDIQSACNMTAITNSLLQVTRRLRELDLNGNDHIAMKWLIDKLASLVDRDVTPINLHEQSLVDKFYESISLNELIGRQEKRMSEG